MIIQGKVWGQTSPLFNYNNVEVHYLNIKEGGYCSDHHHYYKFNKFIVIKGLLKVIVNDLETILGPGHEMTVSPSELHRFEALEDSEVLEIYWVELQTNDIERRNHGGLKK